MQYTIEIVIRYSLYLLSLIFAWIAFAPMVVPSIQKRRSHSRFKGSFDIEEQRSRLPKGKWYRNMELFLMSTIGKSSPIAIFSFISISAFLAILSALFLHENGFPFSNMLIGALLIGGSPTIVLYVRRQTVRVDSSYEADALLAELISQLKLNNLNMLQAIDSTIGRIDKLRYSKKALARLSMKIKESGSAEQIGRYTEEFAYTFKTNWSQLLANNIYLAIVYRDNVKEALDDILLELTGVKSINAKGNQNNSETFLIIKYVAPLGYIASVFGIIRYYHFSWSKFLNYQFVTPMGRKAFVFFFCLLIANYIIYIFIRKPKNDI